MHLTFRNSQSFWSAKSFTPLKSASTPQFIGEILDVKADDSVLGEERGPDVQKIGPFCYDHETSSYYGVAASVGKLVPRGLSCSNVVELVQRQTD